MLYTLVVSLLELAATLIGGACLLRVYMQQQRVPFDNPVGRLVFVLSDWLVLPLRRVLPALGRWDTSSLVAAYLVRLGQIAVAALLGGAFRGVAAWPVVALFGLAQTAITTLMALLIVGAILSWSQAESLVSDVIDRLCAPLLRPVRRIVPLVGRLDLSPLVLLIVLQFAAYALNALQFALLR